MSYELFTSVACQVQQAHIDRGVPREPQCCPVAYAIKDLPLLLQTLHVWVGHDWIRMHSPLGEYHVPTPGKVSDFVLRFDVNSSRKRCVPFKFTLRLPKQWVSVE